MTEEEKEYFLSQLQGFSSAEEQEQEQRALMPNLCFKSRCLLDEGLRGRFRRAVEAAPPPPAESQPLAGVSQPSFFPMDCPSALGDEVAVPRGQEWLRARRGLATSSRLAGLFGFFGGNPEVTRVLERARVWDRRREEARRLGVMGRMGELSCHPDEEVALLVSQEEAQAEAEAEVEAEQAREEEMGPAIVPPREGEQLQAWHNEMLKLVAERLELTHGSMSTVTRFRMSWGSAHEEVAVHQFMAQHPNAHLYPTGMWKWDMGEHVLFGSPDGLDSSNPDVVYEIKCPFPYRVDRGHEFSFLPDFFPWYRLPFHVIFQLQANMAATDRKFCQLISWTLSGFSVFTVARCDEFLRDLALWYGDLQEVLSRLESHNRSCGELSEMRWPPDLPQHPFSNDYHRYHRILLRTRRIAQKANSTRRWHSNTLPMDSRGAPEVPLLPELEAQRYLDNPLQRPA